LSQDVAAPICFRVSLDERELLENAALVRGSSMSSLLREVSLEAARQIVVDNAGELRRKLDAETEKLVREYEGRIARLTTETEIAAVAAGQQIRKAPELRPVPAGGIRTDTRKRVK
jgi:uncharacterized protein (DUF1778 family)